ncbi:MAG: hypothetical protein AAFY19_00810 [Pseudomonadota bacterium]
MIVLALDTSATRTGWCVGPAEGPVLLGSARFGGYGRDIGGLLVAFDDWLTELIQKERPGLIGFEQPCMPMKSLNFVTLRQIYGVAGQVEFTARRAQVGCVEAHNSSIKKLIYGKGGKKPANAPALARSWGFDARNHDEADAAGVFLYTVRHQVPDAYPAWLRRRDGIRAETGETLL